MTTEQTKNSPGSRFRNALKNEKPLQIAGAINAYTARMAEATGFLALYLSGGGVAANSLGMPDLGISTMDDVLTDARRIVDVTTLPLLVDIDTGWGGAFNIARTIRSMERACVRGGSHRGSGIRQTLWPSARKRSCPRGRDDRPD